MVSKFLSLQTRPQSVAIIFVMHAEHGAAAVGSQQSAEQSRAMHTLTHTHKHTNTQRERQAHAHTRVPEMPELVTVATMLHSLLGPSSSTCL